MIVRFVFLAFAGILSAADLPHHLIHPTQRLTAPDRRPASDIARDFTRTSAGSPAIADSLYIAKEYRTQHNGVTHIVYQQQYRGLDVFGGEWVVNLDAQGQVLNAGGKLYDPPAGDAQVPGLGSLDRAVRLSLETVDPSMDARTMTEVAPRSVVKRSYQFAGTGQAAAEGQPVWYPVRGRLEPAWLIYATAQDGIEIEEVIVAAGADRVLHRDPMTWHQAPRGLVYTGRSPQPTPQPGTKLEAEPPYVQRELVPLVGDPIASPKGWFSGNSTAGNNTITGINLLATSFTREPILATSTFSSPWNWAPARRILRSSETPPLPTSSTGPTLCTTSSTASASTKPRVITRNRTLAAAAWEAIRCCPMDTAARNPPSRLRSTTLSIPPARASTAGKP